MKMVYFLGVWGLTTLSYIACNYTTSGHMEYISTIYKYIYTFYKYIYLFIIQKIYKIHIHIFLVWFIPIGLW